jgi:pyrroloquinoline quinone biosynthesis protein E
LKPLTIVAELTYRCPLRCVYCSNPVEHATRDELSATIWRRVLAEAAELGALHVHFTGGEPLLRPELETLVAAAHAHGLYTNLITSGVPLERARLEALVAAGLEHLQLSFQGATAADTIAHAAMPAFEQKLAVASWAKALGLPLTVNFVLHRGNIDAIDSMLELARELDADRIELANAQYLGWAFENRGALLPTAAQIERARERVRAARERLANVELTFVLPDLHAGRPRACMDGWGERYLVIAPDGLLLPCQAARVIPELEFDNVARWPLAALWRASPALLRFRGEQGLPEQCRSCPEHERDHGGCRCQAYLMTGNAGAVDPACALSPHHEAVVSAQLAAERGPASPARHRRLVLAPLHG